MYRVWPFIFVTFDFILPVIWLHNISSISKHEITCICIADDRGNYDKRYHQMAIIICTKADLLLVKISR